MPASRPVVRIVAAVALLVTTLSLQLPASVFADRVAAQQGRPPGSMLAQSAQTPLPGHVPALLARATPLPAVSADGEQTISFSVVLRRTNEAGFQAYLQAVNDPRSPTFRRFATQRGELANRFGPSQQAYDAVMAYLLRNGFTLVRGSTDRLMITVQGTRGQINRVLGAQIQSYQWDGRVVFANSADPSVPTTLAPSLLGIVGLNNLGRGRPANGAGARPLDDVAAAPLAVPAAQATATPQPRSLRPVEVAQAYNAQGVLLPSGTPATGAGQTIGLVEFSSFNGTNVARQLSTVGPCLTPTTQAACVQSFLSRLTVIPVGGNATATATLLPTPGLVGGDQSEALLDIAAVMGMAQGANYTVYEHTSSGSDSAFNNALLLMLNGMSEQPVNVISSSWSQCENSATVADTIAFAAVIQQAAGKGISTFFAINDEGNACNGDLSLTDQTSFPTGAPYTIAVGGTIMNVGANGQYLSETWWGSGNGGPHDCVEAFNSTFQVPPPNPNNGGCGGFGHSKLYPAPIWQIPFLTPQPTPMRQVPDVVAYAWPGIIRVEDVPSGDGGTSLATPLWAAGIALINEAIGGATGALLPTLYQLNNTSAFHPPSTMLPLPSVPGGGNDFTHVGLGSPNLGGLAALLAPTPTGGATATATRTATATATATIHPLTQTAIALTGTPTPTIHPLTQTAVAQTATIQALTATATATIHPLTQTAIVQTATIQALTATATPTIHPLTQTAVAQTATVQALTATATPTIHPLTQTAIALTPTATSTPVRAPTSPPAPVTSGTPGVPAATTVGQTIVFSGGGSANGVSGTWTKTGSGAFTFAASNTTASIVPGSIPALTLPTTAGNESGTPLAGAATVCTPVGAAPPFTTTCRGTTVGDVLLGAQVSVTFATAGGGTAVSTGAQVAGATASSLTTAQAQTQAQGTAGFLLGAPGIACAPLPGQQCAVSGAATGTLTRTSTTAFTLTGTVPAGAIAGVTPVAVFSTDAGLQAVACAAAAGAPGTTYSCTGTLGGNALQGSTAALCFTATTPCLLGTVAGPGAVPLVGSPPLLPPPPVQFLPPPPPPLLPPPPVAPVAGPPRPAPAGEIPLIPEAESALLMGLGLGAVALLARWRQRRRPGSGSPQD